MGGHEGIARACDAGDEDWGRGGCDDARGRAHSGDLAAVGDEDAGGTAGYQGLGGCRGVGEAGFGQQGRFFEVHIDRGVWVGKQREQTFRLAGAGGSDAEVGFCEEGGCRDFGQQGFSQVAVERDLALVGVFRASKAAVTERA